MSDWWWGYLAGVGTIPALWCCLHVVIIVGWAVLDTRVWLRKAELKRGYSRLNWVTIPFRVFFHRLRVQIQAAWCGYETWLK